MLRFTEEEFQIMVDELLDDKKSSADMLCHIAKKTLSDHIHFLCFVELDGYNKAEDIANEVMQNIYLRLIQITVTKFLLKDGPEGPVNNDPVGFQRWLFTVADNVKRATYKKERVFSTKTVDIDDPKYSYLAKNEKYPVENEDIINIMFAIAVKSGARVYKILSWLLQSLYVLDLGTDRINANEELLNRFTLAPLSELYQEVTRLAQRFKWLHFTEEHKRILNTELSQRYDERSFGEVPFNEFFMLFKGAKNGKKSVSDWVNRMDAVINKRFKEIEERGYKDDTSNS